MLGGTKWEAEEEVLLARKIQAMIGFESIRDNLKETLKRDPTAQEWADAVGLPVELLQKRRLLPKTGVWLTSWRVVKKSIILIAWHATKQTVKVWLVFSQHLKAVKW